MRLLLISPKQAEATRRLQEEAANLGMEMTVMEVGELAEQSYAINPDNHDALFIRQAYVTFDEKVPSGELQQLVDFAKSFKQKGKVVVDAAIADGDIGGGKYEALIKLKDNRVNIPNTFLLSDNKGQHSIDFPVVVKWNFGFAHKHVYLIKDQEQLNQLRLKYKQDELLIQEYIPADREYKVMVVGYKSLPVVIRSKYLTNRLSADLSEVEVLPADSVSEIVALGEHAATILNRELSKIDILEKSGQLYVLEANRWPGFQHFEKASGYNVAKTFLEYIRNKPNVS
jgi:glutathione synthase/RimK-type ligase-like ATP-grasp enzyme